LEKSKIKLTGERPMKNSQAEEEDYIIIMSLLPSKIKWKMTLKDWNSEWNF